MAKEIGKTGKEAAAEPIHAKGYGFRVTFNGDMIVIDRNRLVASTYGFAQTVVPLGSIVDVTLGKATIFVNGLFCLSVRTMDGDSPLIASSTESRKSPYCAIYTKQHEREFRRLYEAIKAALPREPLPIAYDQMPETRYMRQMQTIPTREGKAE